jgi:hypothetical protein
MGPVGAVLHEVHDQADDGAVHVGAARAGLALVEDGLVGLAHELGELFTAVVRVRLHGVQQVLHGQARRDIAAAVAAGAIGQHAGEMTLGMPVAAGVFVVRATAAFGQDGDFHGQHGVLLSDGPGCRGLARLPAR